MTALGQLFGQHVPRDRYDDEGAPVAGVKVAPGATDELAGPQNGGYCAADETTQCGLADECQPFHCREDRR